jgi:hypothetical protein
MEDFQGGKENVYISPAPVIEQKKTNWFLIFLIPIILIILIVMGMMIIYSLRQTTITQEELLEGKGIELKEKQKITFEINESENHSLTVNSVASDLVEITIQSEKITLILRIGEEKEVDLNNNGISDLYIKLIKIENNKPSFVIKKIIPSPSVKPMEIEEQGEITNNSEESITNVTPTTNDTEPFNNETPQEKTCSQKGGKICNSDENCSIALISAFDTNKCCPGICERVNLPEEKLKISGDLMISGIGTNGKLMRTNCFGMAKGQATEEPFIFDDSQILLFNLENTFSRTFGENFKDYIEYDIYVDNNKVNLAEYSRYGRLRRLTGESFMDFTIPPGKNEVFVEFKKSIAGKRIKIVLDPNKKFLEEPISIENIFPDEKMDISYDSIEYKTFMNQTFILLKRDKKLEECPAFMTEIYLNGERYNDAAFYGFSKSDGADELGGRVWGPKDLQPGQYEIRIVIDSTKVVDESNENNNDLTVTLTVP